MLAEIYIEALLVDEELADQVQLTWSYNNPSVGWNYMTPPRADMPILAC